LKPNNSIIHHRSGEKSTKKRETINKSNFRLTFFSRIWPKPEVDDHNLEPPMMADKLTPSGQMNKF